MKSALPEYRIAGVGLNEVALIKSEENELELTRSASSDKLSESVLWIR